MNQVIINRRTYAVPGHFNELSPRQLLAVVTLLHAGLPTDELRLRLVLVLLDVPRRLAFALWFRFTAEQRHELLPLADFCFREPQLMQQLLPRLRVGYSLTHLTGPAGAFLDLPFSTFIQAEGLLHRAGREVEALDQFVAVLYNGTAQQTRRVPTAAKRAVLLWYTSCRTGWAKKYNGTIFAPGDATQAPSDPRETWREILAERAGSPVHYEEYGRQLVPNVFYDLDLRIRRLREHRQALTGDH